MRTGEVLGVVPANEVSGPETGHSEEYRPFLVAERFHTHWDERRCDDKNIEVCYVLPLEKYKKPQGTQLLMVT